jgi:peptide chain release factor 1
MRELLEQNLERFEHLERQLVDPEVLSNPARLSAVAREHGSLAKVATKYRKFKNLNAQIAEAQEMLKGEDPDLRDLAESELPQLRAEREACWNELLDLTVGGEDANRTSCIVEIRAGTGGDEAALFARDLYEMYKHYAEKHRWKVEVIDLSPTELGGFKEIILGMEGEGVFRHLQYESGGHRVQRVPETEAKGRVHTSAATVAVLAEPEDVEIDVKPEDYVRETFRSSGPGGQNVNKTSSAIRLTHLATGIVVKCQDESSQHKNMAKALRVLKTRLYEAKREADDRKRSSERRTKIGSGDRSEKVRTYNFPQNRCTDHRINQNFNLQNVIAGDLEPVIEALTDYVRREQRGAFGDME